MISRRCIPPIALLVKREYDVAFQRDQRVRLREKIIAAYGGACMCKGGCNVTEPRFLTIDHVDGGGAAERRRMPYLNILRKIAREGFPKTYRVLCMNCNFAVRNGEPCPHEF